MINIFITKANCEFTRC